MRKPRTTNPAISARDKYLRKKFLYTEKEYNEALRKNGGVCWISGTPPGTKSLAIDHDHKIERWKISSMNENGLWYSWPQGFGVQESGQGRLRFVEYDRIKSVSRAKVKARLKRLSVRGILCWKSNSALQKFNDDPELMRRSAEYIENYQKFLAGESNYRNGFEGE